MYGRGLRSALPLGVPVAVADVLALRATTVERILILVVGGAGVHAGVRSGLGHRQRGQAWTPRLAPRARSGHVDLRAGGVFLPLVRAPVGCLACPRGAVSASGNHRRRPDADGAAPGRRAVPGGLCPCARLAGDAGDRLRALPRRARVPPSRAGGQRGPRRDLRRRLVVSPLLFLGAALLYFDQAARVSSSSSRNRSAGGVNGTSRA